MEYTEVTLAEVDRSIISSSTINKKTTFLKIKTKKCQSAARDTPDIIQTECVPDRGLACPKNKNKLNVKYIIKKNQLECTEVTLAEFYRHTRSSSTVDNKKKTEMWNIVRSRGRDMRDGKSMCNFLTTGNRRGIGNKLRNRRQRSYNGNINKNIKVVHWNLGSSHWIRKVHTIEAMLTDLDPDIAQ